jgi:hypothetical protein
MTEPDRSPPGDELTERYREASARDTRRPGAHVRDAVRAHAQMVIDAGKAQGANAAGGTAQTKQTNKPAANQSRWKISALATVALAGLTGLLVLQFDRGNDEEKDLVFGQRSASAPPAAQAPVPAPPPAAAPATTLPQPAQTSPPEVNAQARAGNNAPPAPKAPAKPAAEKPAPQRDAPDAAAKAAAETAGTLGGAAPAPAMTQDSAGFTPSTRAAEAPVIAPLSRSAPAMAAPAPAAPAAPAAAAEQRQEKSAAPTRSLRAEATGSLGLAGALQQSARAGDLQQLERLLQQGAPLNAADAAGRTPLILAVMQGHTAIVQRLLAAGANTALIDKDGLNALQHAQRLGFDGIAHLIERAT